MHLSAREISLLLWGTAFLCWGLYHQPVRAQVPQLVRAAANRHIIGLVAFLGIWTAGSVLVLRELELWTTEHIKDAACWFALVGLTTGGRALASYRDPDYRGLVLDSFRLTAVVEFVVALAPFSLLTELVLVPVLGLLGLMVGAAGIDPRHASTRRVLEWMLGLAGMAIVVGAAAQAWNDLQAFANADSLRSFLLPPSLSLLLIPGLSVVVIQARFEWLFGKIQGGWVYRTYARARLATKLGPRPNAVLDFGRRYAFDLPHVRTVRGLEKMLRNPPSHSVDVEALRRLSESGER